MIEEIKVQCSSALEFDLDIDRRRSNPGADSSDLPQTYIDYLKGNEEKQELTQKIDEAQKQNTEAVIYERRTHDNNILISIE